MSASKTKRHWSASLTKIGACSDAVTWAKEQPSLQAAWDSCHRGDWMMWLAGKTCDRKAVVLAACDCAETVLPIFEKRYPDDKRPRVAIETARRWARGEATDAELRAARAYAAADAAYTDAYTAAAAAAAADAAYAAAYTAAAYAAAADAAYAAAAARTKKLAECADIVRRHFPAAPSLNGGAA